MLLCYSPLSFLIRKLFVFEPRRTGRYHFILLTLLLVFIHLMGVFRRNLVHRAPRQDSPGAVPLAALHTPGCISLNSRYSKISENTEEIFTFLMEQSNLSLRPWPDCDTRD